MSAYSNLCAELAATPQSWLVTGGAGFIGSHVVEKLLSLGQKVRVLDNLSTGYQKNLAHLQEVEFIQGDIRQEADCYQAVQGVQRIIHLSAMGSVPLSMEKPAECHAINATGTLNIFLAAREAGVAQISYASSSAVYGDDSAELKIEPQIGNCLSPYAASKRMNEIHAQTLHACYGFKAVGLRFFNVFGPRQDPNGAYAAVIPQWLQAMSAGQDVYINGDGSNTRDFCFVRDIVQSLLLAATTENTATYGQVYNVGLGKASSLIELFNTMRSLLVETTGLSIPDVIHRAPRAGDILHSCADASRIQKDLGFTPQHTVMEGLREIITGV